MYVHSCRVITYICVCVCVHSNYMFGKWLNIFNVEYLFIQFVLMKYGSIQKES